MHLQEPGFSAWGQETLSSTKPILADITWCPLHVGGPRRPCEPQTQRGSISFFKPTFRLHKRQLSTLTLNFKFFMGSSRPGSS